VRTTSQTVLQKMESKASKGSYFLPSFFQNKRVMKSQQEIEARLSDCKAEYEHLKEWNEKALQKYLEDKKYWGGEADRLEYEYSGQLMTQCIKEIEFLEWVLNTENTEI
ncbi:MAG: hypothetical protein EBQ89_05815, partial [Alphaproteobacteria bacterium]|nr:hypothetical protein [Alphaproteobacteria bacterium]